MKSIKNYSEIKHMINAHKIDGLALTKFIYWIKNINNKIKCPNCPNNVKRISSNSLDGLYTKLSFKLFEFKRYTCFSCYWEGRLW